MTTNEMKRIQKLQNKAVVESIKRSEQRFIIETTENQKCSFCIPVIMWTVITSVVVVITYL